MQPELKGDLTRPVIQHRVDERHDRGFQGEIVLVDTEILVQVVYDALESRSLGMILLEVQHGFQNLSMTTRYQAHRAQNLQNGDLRFDVLSRQRLGYSVDGGRVCQNVRPSVLQY